MKRHFSVLLAGVALCAGIGLWHVAVAQSEVKAGHESKAQAAEMKGDVKVYTLRVKNVAPSVIAWWLDAKNHSEPAMFHRERNSNSMADPKDGNSTLPTGVERIVAVDPQNALLVFATEAGLQSIKEVVAFLDRPLRQVEIEAQLIQISAEDARQLGIERTKSPVPNAGMQINFVRGNYPAILKRLAAENKVKITPLSRVLAINTLEASIPMENEMRLLVTPTINNDNTVTVMMSTVPTLKLSEPSDKPVLSPQGKGIVSIVNARDGDTVALSGLASSLFPTPQSDLISAPLEVLFVTPRIVHRAEDDRPAAKP